MGTRQQRVEGGGPVGGRRTEKLPCTVNHRHQVGKQESGSQRSTDVSDRRRNIMWETEGSESGGTEFSRDVSDTRCGKFRRREPCIEQGGKG